MELHTWFVEKINKDARFSLVMLISLSLNCCACKN